VQKDKSATKKEEKRILFAHAAALAITGFLAKKRMLGYCQYTPSIPKNKIHPYYI